MLFDGVWYNFKSDLKTFVFLVKLYRALIAIPAWYSIKKYGKIIKKQPFVLVGLFSAIAINLMWFLKDKEINAYL